MALTELNYIDLCPSSTTSHSPGGASAIVTQNCLHMLDVGTFVKCDGIMNNVFFLLKIQRCLILSKIAGIPHAINQFCGVVYIDVLRLSLIHVTFNIEGRKYSVNK